MTVRIGPAGIGPIKEIAETFAKYKKLGIKTAEIPFTYGVFIKEERHKKEIEEIKKAVKENDIQLSVHAPYWINLNSEDEEKVEKSKERILKSAKMGELLGAKYVVFHPGYYGKMEPGETYDKIRDEIIDMQNTIKEAGWKIQLAPETTGKVNVFGKEEEILKLVEDTGCFFTLDFSHLLARSRGEMSYKKMVEKVAKFDKLHCHFSGIEWGDKGERKHKMLEEKEIKKLVAALPKDKEMTIINESPDTVADAMNILREYNGL